VVNYGGGSSLQPYQFAPEAFGAKGDALVTSDGTIAGGALTVVNSASGAFANAVPGMKIVVEAAGAVIAGTSTASALSTTISTVNSATQVVMAAPASGAVTGRTTAFGTDDTTAINAAIAAGAAYARAHNWYFQLWCIAKGYMVGGPLIQGGASLTNSQVPFPVAGIAGNPAMTMAIAGTRDNAGPGMFAASGDTPAVAWNGTAFISTLTGQVYSATFGQPAMFGGPTSEQGYTGGFTNLWNNLVIVLDGVTFLVPPIASISGIDMTSCTQLEAPHVRANAMAPNNVLAGAAYNPVWSGAQSFPKGIVCPQGGNNAHVVAGSMTAAGFASGVESYEQFTCTELITILNGNGLVANGANAGHNTATILKWSAEANNTHLLASQASGINIVSMQAEPCSQYAAGFYVDDSGNLLHGRIGVNSSIGTATITVNGGANLEIIADYTSNGVTRGLQTPPAVPLTTVPLVNPFFKNCTVGVTGATITAITANGIAWPVPGAGVTNVQVPTGKSITLAYPSGTPTWVWTAA
jgi:hypothetical protein